MPNGRPPARAPEDLAEFFIQRGNAGDADGLVALYEPDAVLALPGGRVAAGHAEIRAAYRELLASRPVFSSGGQRPALRNGDLALTSTRLPGGGTTAEVARRQPDGTWLWAIDQPSLLSSLSGSGNSLATLAVTAAESGRDRGMDAGRAGPRGAGAPRRGVRRGLRQEAGLSRP
jgi:ketosteroid isomerase-like protein